MNDCKVLIFSIIVSLSILSTGSFFAKSALAVTAPPDVIYDPDGIPLVYYGNTTGYQRNPVTTSLALMHYHDMFLSNKNSTMLQYMKNSANWLVVNAKHYGNYSLLEYEFPYRYDLSPPWHSALAQGFAIQALTKAYAITNNSAYLDATTPLLNSFYVDVKDGGITEKTNSSGWWYEEYAGKGGQNPRVLNGMMYDLLALHEYYNYTDNSKAKFLFDQGVLSLKNNIAIYDANGSSYYDSLKLPADVFYQKAHIDLLYRLYEITGEPIFKQYHDKWASYLQAESSQNKSASTPEFGSISGIIITISLIFAIIITRKFKPYFQKNNLMK